MANWYAVHTKARQEAIAAQHLGNQAYRTHLPLMRSPKRRGGRWQAQAEPLFPGYLFVELDIHRQDTVPIRSTRGVVGLVRFGNKLCPLPQGLVDGLIRSQPPGDESIDLEKLFCPGDEVAIVDGPFQGLRAIVKARSSKERVCVLLDLLGQANRVTLSSHQIAPVV